jgi:hypothetical protein
MVDRRPWDFVENREDVCCARKLTELAYWRDGSGPDEPARAPLLNELRELVSRRVSNDALEARWAQDDDVDRPHMSIVVRGAERSKPGWAMATDRRVQLLAVRPERHAASVRCEDGRS